MSGFQRVIATHHKGVITYKVGDKIIDPEKGGTATIRWPDGIVEDVTFLSKPEIISYMEMGMPVHVERCRLIIVDDPHGVRVEFPLEAVEARDIAQET